MGPWRPERPYERGREAERQIETGTSVVFVTESPLCIALREFDTCPRARAGEWGWGCCGLAHCWVIGRAEPRIR